MRRSFHPPVSRDLRSALRYYEEEAGPEVAGRFENEFRGLAAAIEENPKRFHRVPVSKIFWRRRSGVVW
jgi:plasmid stabilization system protein ParE